MVIGRLIAKTYNDTDQSMHHYVSMTLTNTSILQYTATLTHLLSVHEPRLRRRHGVQHVLFCQDRFTQQQTHLRPPMVIVMVIAVL